MRELRFYLADVAEALANLLCTLTGHAGACALLRYSTRRWNPIAAAYHWGVDVWWAEGSRRVRCGCLLQVPQVVTGAPDGYQPTTVCFEYDPVMNTMRQVKLRIWTA